MTAALARAAPGRDIHVVADAAYAGTELRRLPATVTWTTRLRKDAALDELPGARTGKRGRPRAKGKRLPRLAALADGACFAPVAVRRYGTTTTAPAAVVQCLWYGAFGPRPAQVVLIRDHTQTGDDLALATTDLAASPAAVIERYAARWPLRWRSRTPTRSSVPGRPATGCPRRCTAQCRSPSPARTWPCCGTPPPGTTPATRTTTVPAPPGTGPRPSRQPLT